MKRKIITIIILSALVVTLTVPILTYPKATQAFLDSGTIFWPVKVGIDITNKIAVWIDKVLGKTGAIAYKNALSYFLSKIAQDTAVWISSGGKGAAPLFITDGWGSYLQDAGDNALGIFMYDLFNADKEGKCKLNPDQPCSSNSDCPMVPISGQEFENELNMLMIEYDAAVAKGDMELADEISESIDIMVEDGSYKFDICIKSSPVNVCEPGNLQTKLLIQYSLIQAKDPNLRTPQCTWTELSTNWRESINDKDFLKNFSASLDPVQTDIGIWLSVQTDLDNAIGNAVDNATKMRSEGGGFKPLTNLVGKIKTPSIMISKSAQQTIEDRSKNETTYTGQIWADALGVFTSTLANRLMDKWLKKGMAEINNLINPKTGNFGGLQFSGSGGGITPQQAARSAYAELGKPNYASGGSVGVTTVLASDCETDPQIGGEQFCGIIDNNFATAINQKLTVRQAIDQGLINADSPFGFTLPSLTEPDYRSGLPYRSILVLRKYRIVPVGWELAAKYIEKFAKEEIADIKSHGGQSLSLNYLINNYNNPESKFYKLVDPGWLLKAPETICYRQGPGPDIIDEQVVCQTDTSGIACPPDEPSIFVTRRTYCADERSCIVETDDGTDCKFYGYCTSEKPIWRLDGAMCPAVFNTCETFTTPDGQHSYLENTLAECSITNANCKAYCTVLDPVNNVWMCPDTTSPLSFNKTTKICSEKDEGCVNLIRVGLTPLSSDEIGKISDINNTEYVETPVNLKLAPAYADEVKNGCDGYTTVKDYGNQADCETANFYWRDDINACVQSGNKYCSNFIMKCSETDIGCRLYTPVNITAPPVAAKIQERECSGTEEQCADESYSGITWNDECPAQCSGFHTYSKQKTNFEETEMASFVGTDAKVCNQPGCDEFTNLDEVARGGEGIEYYSYLRLCVKPDDTSASIKTFYTWEGSDTAGYQLKKWLLQANGDKPFGDACSVGDLTVDCREFYNPATNFYDPIDFKTVIFAVDDCHPLRRSLSTTQAECKDPGKWQNNTCVYYGMPSPNMSTTCSADNAGCRIYRDNSSYNYQVILQDDFEDGNVDGWSAGELSNESSQRHGKSLKIVANASNSNTATTEHELNLADLVPGDSYSITYLARFNGNMDDGKIIIQDGTDILGQMNFDSTGNWGLYTVNLGILPELNFNNPKLIFRAHFGQSAVDSAVYFDYIILKRINNLLVIKDSWQPSNALCESLSVAGMSWCEIFKDNYNTTWYLQGFNDICLEDVVGCEAMISFDNYGNRNWSYYVYDKTKLCSLPGCKKLGELVRDKFAPQNKDKFIFKDVFKVFTPADECPADSEGCVQMSYDNGGGVIAVKNPDGRVCEFANGQWWVKGEENVLCPRSSGSGYCFEDRSLTCFNNTDCSNVNSANDFCVMEGYCSNNPTVLCNESNPCGASLGGCIYPFERHCLGGRAIGSISGGNNICQNDTDCVDYYNFSSNGICTSWTGVCPDSESGCEEYQDPFEPMQCDNDLLPNQFSNKYLIYEKDQTPACNFYWYKDVVECDSSADISQGCVKFVNTSEPVVTP
ncbi:MAG: hypothetical protein ABIF17_02925 [Patescibacteria group bacterium]